MAQLARKSRQSATVSDISDAVRSKGLKLVSDTLPKAADATDRIGQGAADFILSSSHSLARALRNRTPGTAKQLGGALGTSWLLRKAGRLVARRPATVLIGGIAIAAIGVAVWRLSQQPADEAEAEPTPQAT